MQKPDEKEAPASTADTAPTPTASAAPSPAASDLSPEECHSRCEGMLENAQSHLNTKILAFNLEKLGCKLKDDFFKCKPCFPNKSIIGGFANDVKGGKPGIVICEDNVERLPQSVINRTVVHELVHAYDQCRAEVDWKDCLHIACTEVRAANLSGDCSFTTEINRGNLKIKGQGDRCCRRRAELSVSMHPQCKDIAKAAVEQVFDSCMADRAPFIGKFYA